MERVDEFAGEFVPEEVSTFVDINERLGGFRILELISLLLGVATVGEKIKTLPARERDTGGYPVRTPEGSRMSAGPLGSPSSKPASFFWESSFRKDGRVE